MKSIVLVTLLFAFVSTSAYAQVTVTLDSTTKFQTIEGWGHGGDLFGMLNYSADPSIMDSLNLQILDYLIDDLGLTGSRIWEVGPRTDGTGMDNGDCDSVDWTKFEVTQNDTMVAKYMVYFKNRIEANGYHTSFYSSTSYPTGATLYKPWVFNDPGERAQQIWANALWWKNTYGITMNYDVIFNEPGGTMTPQLIADDIKALGPRMLKLGLPTKTQYAEAVTPSTDWNFISPEEADTDVWQYIGRLSYHNYGSLDGNRQKIRDFGITKGLTIAQTEMGDPRIDDIFDDMLLGGTSYWEVAFSGSNTLTPNAGELSFLPAAKFFRQRQVIHYIRPGDVRINGTSTDSNVRVLSFERNGELRTIILNNTAAQTVTIHGLPAGNYGISQSNGTNGYQELGVHSVGADGMLSFMLQGSSYATTIYPHKIANYAPDIMTFSVSPGYLVPPATAATLSATASDPEMDPLTFSWSVVSQPSGADALLESASKATCVVNGLSVAGIYVFQINVSDGVNTVSRKVYLQVYPSNPPPVMGNPGFRIDAPYGLVFADPPTETHANVELPTSSATLQAQIGDLANDAFDGRGKWTLVSEPQGAHAVIDTTIYIFISIRANASGMTVPGDYVFQINVTNPGHPDLVGQCIFTVHPASEGPIINSASATPPFVTLPTDSSKLTSATIDTAGQLLRYWWAIKTVPAGAKPIFDHQGLATTNVSGLTIPGNYTFTLNTFDDLHMSQKDVTVIVQPATKGVESTVVMNEDVLIYPNPATDELHVQLSDANDRIVRTSLLNSLGQEVGESTGLDLKDGAITLALKSLPSGLYFARVQTSKNISTVKIAKQ
jgi:hypothetical protein